MLKFAILEIGMLIDVGAVRMSDDTRFKILTDFMMKSMEEEEEGENLVETDRASADTNRLKGGQPCFSVHLCRKLFQSWSFG